MISSAGSEVVVVSTLSSSSSAQSRAVVLFVAMFALLSLFDECRLLESVMRTGVE